MQPVKADLLVARGFKVQISTLAGLVILGSRRMLANFPPIAFYFLVEAGMTEFLCRALIIYLKVFGCRDSDRRCEAD